MLYHPQSAIRNPQSAIRNPQSAIRNPQSAIRNPQSAKKQNLIGAECKRNRRFFGTNSEVKLLRKFERITKGKAVLSIVVPERERYPCTAGFTLIEMMVVIGLIAIIGAWAVPGLKKAYEGFKFAETFDHLDTFRSSFRAYYLIMNEFPSDSSRNRVKAKVAWCLPSSYYTRTLISQEYVLNVTTG